MGAGTIYYFGQDPAETRQSILQQAGYTVRRCEWSLDQLLDALQEPDLTAAILSDIPDERAEQMAEAIHAHSHAAVVFFRDDQFARNPRAFDAVIPPLTPPETWLNMVADVIAIGTAARAKSILLRTQAARLRSEATSLRQESGALRQEAQRQRENAEATIERTAQFTGRNE